MKKLSDYLNESAFAAENPVTGDVFAINIREECLVESVVLEHDVDGIVIAADEKMLEIFESYGITVEDVCMECGLTECECVHETLDDTVDVEYADEEPQPNPGEYDDEGDMAKTELHTMIRAARKLIGMLDDADNMPEWTQKKITKATDYVDTAADYIASEKERGVMEQGVAEVSKATLDRYVAKAVDSHGDADFSARMSKHDPDKRSYHVDQKKTAEKRRRGISRALDRMSKEGVAEGSEDVSPVARAVLHRIMMAHPGVLAQHGPERVMSAVDELADRVNIGPDDEIGTSDVSGWVRDVIRMLSELPDESMSDVDALDEAEYQGRKVTLNKPTRGDVKKFKVYVKDPSTGNVKKVNFGDPDMKIKKSNPERRKSFRARHKCDTAKDKTTARYWSCRKW